MAALVTSRGTSFIVRSGWDIHNVPEYHSLPLEDKKFLALESIKGMYRGFVLTSDFRSPIVITADSVRFPSPVFLVTWEKKETIKLILPEGTCIEPITHQQIEEARTTPSLRER